MLIELHQNVLQWTAEYKTPGSDMGEASCMPGIIFFYPFPPLKVPCEPLFEPVVIDGRCVLDRAELDWPRARCSDPIVSPR